MTILNSFTKGLVSKGLQESGNNNSIPGFDKDVFKHQTKEAKDLSQILKLTFVCVHASES